MRVMVRYLMPFSTIFQLHVPGYIVVVSFIGGKKQSIRPEKTTDLALVPDKLYHIMLYSISNLQH